MVEAIIHDWDGVLNNSMDAVLKTYSIVYRKPLEFIRRKYNPDWRKFEKEAKLPKVSGEEWRRVFQEQVSDVKLFSGVKEYLHKIKDNKYKLALVTSGGSSRIINDLNRYKLSSVFNTVVTAEDVKKLKPNPQCLKIAIKRLDSSIPECVFIGDTKEDALAAKGIDINFIGVSWGYHSPKIIRSVNNDPIANNFDELYEMIKKL